jgi:hypothetical protein
LRIATVVGCGLFGVPFRVFVPAAACLLAPPPGHVANVDLNGAGGVSPKPCRDMERTSRNEVRSSTTPSEEETASLGRELRGLPSAPYW